MRDLIIFGAGGHAKVILDMALKNGYTVKGFLDDNAEIKEVLGYPKLGRVDDCVKFQSECDFIIGIGNNLVRRRIYEKYPLNFVTLVHPSAIIAKNVKIGEGTVVMAGAVVNTCTEIGRCVVVNTAAVVEHDNIVGDFTLLAPHSTLCGAVSVGSGCWIGAGSTVNNTVSICDDVIIGSGAVAIENITDKGTYVGIPAKKVK